MPSSSLAVQDFLKIVQYSPSNIPQLLWSTVGPSLEIMSLAFPASASDTCRPTFLADSQKVEAHRGTFYNLFLKVGISSFSQRFSESPGVWWKSLHEESNTALALANSFHPFKKSHALTDVDQHGVPQT